MKKTILALTAVLMTSGLALAEVSGGDPGGSTGALDVQARQAVNEQAVDGKTNAHALGARRAIEAGQAEPKPIFENSRDFRGNR